MVAWDAEARIGALFTRIRFRGCSVTCGVVKNGQYATRRTQAVRAFAWGGSLALFALALRL
jgi:hypothetical protein